MSEKISHDKHDKNDSGGNTMSRKKFLETTAVGLGTMIMLPAEKTLQELQKPKAEQERLRIEAEQQAKNVIKGLEEFLINKDRTFYVSNWRKNPFLVEKVKQLLQDAGSSVANQDAFHTDPVSYKKISLDFLPSYVPDYSKQGFIHEDNVEVRGQEDEKSSPILKVIELKTGKEIIYPYLADFVGKNELLEVQQKKQEREKQEAEKLIDYAMQELSKYLPNAEIRAKAGYEPVIMVSGDGNLALIDLIAQKLEQDGYITVPYRENINANFRIKVYEKQIEITRYQKGKYESLTIIKIKN